MAPGSAKAAIFRLVLNSKNFSYLKDRMLAMVWIKMARRLVPLARGLSNPRKIKRGREMADPPPAMTFRNPEIIPTTISKRRKRISCISQPLEKFT
jgi:hypothetical protein